MSTYHAIRIEGGLLGPETFDQLMAAELPGQKPDDFGLPAKTSLTDEIAAVFADARALWGVFQNRFERVPENDPATSVTRDAWVVPFLGLLGYEPQFNAKSYDVEGRSFPISHRADAADDSPPLHIVGARQELGRVPESGRPRIAPHTLVQEYLNRTEQLWGVVTNGLVLRLLRDCTFVRRQAYVEFDLETIVDEQRFQDFAVLYRLLHRTRLPRGAADAADCLLEKYYATSVEQGGRVRDHLRDGVKECITRLANGFLAHPANDELRRRLSPDYTEPDRISPEKLYRELLRLVYRLLFLLVSEDRGILGRSTIYREHYGVARLRRLADERAAYTDDIDLCQSLRLLWRLLSNDQPQQGLDGRTLASLLGLPVLNGELFAPIALDEFTISNTELLGAFWHLARYQENRTAPMRRVNYAALDVEELGSVYESLLDYHPAVDFDAAGRPAFSLLEGSERKTTGSYYTPPELVAELIKSALEPVLAERLASSEDNLPRPSLERAILNIRVCDPACGSGHFLLAAARRLGKELARVRTGDDEPPPEAVREAVRDVISHSIYGVDKNPLAVDLCQVALWLESHTADKPLTFLRHRIRPGDSLVGVFDLEKLRDGIPDKAFEAREGDDKAVARELLRLNRDERTGGRLLFDWDPQPGLLDLTAHSRELDTIADDSPEAIRRKNALFDQSHADPVWRRQKLGCDLWTAAFFQPLTAGSPAITSAALADVLAGKTIDLRVESQATAIAAHNLFFHWPLEFPEVFADGGFDVVLSNPPWERLKLQEQEFFAARDARIANAANKAARRELIRALPQANPELHRQFIDALRGAAGASAIMRHGGRFPLTGRGDINTYAVFAETCRKLLNPAGRCGAVLPSGIAFADTTKTFFENLVGTRSLVSLLSFFEIRQIFPATDSRDPFCLLTAASGARPLAVAAQFAFNAHRVADIHRPEKRFTLSAEDIELLNPNTRTCPIFQTALDAELTKAIYRRIPVLWRDARGDRGEENPWRLSFKTLFHMANDSVHFRTAEQLEKAGCRREGNVFANSNERYLPLYEAKMLHQFDHRWTTYDSEPRHVTPQEKRDPSFVVQPRYWVAEETVESAITTSAEATKAFPEWLIGYRRVCRTSDERSAIFSLLPRTAVGDSEFLLTFADIDRQLQAMLATLFNAFCFDYVVRQKVGGANFSFYLAKQLPAPSISAFVDENRDVLAALSVQWFLQRSLELNYTAYDLKAFARDCGYDGPPFRWEDERRNEIRAELDAAFFHLYLPCDDAGQWKPAERETPEQLAALKRHFATPRDAVAYILDQFPLVRQREEQVHGRYRTRDRILEIYDQMLAAQRTGRPYESALNPPPGDPRAAHSDPRVTQAAAGEPRQRELVRGTAIAYVHLLLGASNAIMTRQALQTGVILMADDELRNAVLAEQVQRPKSTSGNNLHFPQLDKLLERLTQTGALRRAGTAGEAFELGPNAAPVGNVPPEYHRRATEALRALKIVGDTEALLAYKQKDYETLVLV